jgi:hypothetical protein
MLNQGVPACTYLCTASPSIVEVAVAGLDAWFDTMRGDDGYGGPVAHWWQQSLLYTGPGLDWRYEGIIAGYLTLWERTANAEWLAKACRSGEDLVHGQTADGHFRASAFEINPATAGTPHEAACDAGLLLLARALRAAGDDGWHRYAATAQRNLESFYIGQLWDPDQSMIRDSISEPSFVPNKAATACEALFLLTELTADERWVERYVLPTLHHILVHQLRDGGRLDGAIAQNSFGARKVEKYFPIYIARCIPALMEGYHWTSDEKYLDAALRAMAFLYRWIDGDGALPTVVYANSRVNRYPSWIAPLGDVLRAGAVLRDHGIDADLSAVTERLLDGRDESGGIRTAFGFMAQTGGSPTGVPDLRDALHVVGWCDKAFRSLTMLVEADLPHAESAPRQIECVFQGRALVLIETPDVLECLERGVVRYRWRKGARWAEIAEPEFWLR